MQNEKEFLPEHVVNNIAVALQGKADQNLVDSIVKKVSLMPKVAHGKLTIDSFLFYMRVEVSISGGKTFDGNSGGLSFPGPGLGWGDLYTNDINALYNSTKSFMFDAAVAYLSVTFFDAHSNVLGTFQSGGLSSVVGTGGGTGHWS